MVREVDAGDIHFLRHAVLDAGAPVVVAVGVAVCRHVKATRGGIVAGFLPVVHALFSETVLQGITVDHRGLLTALSGIGGTESFRHLQQDRHLLVLQCHAREVGYHFRNDCLDTSGLLRVIDLDSTDFLILIVDGDVIIVAYLEAVDHLPSAVFLLLGLAHTPPCSAAALYTEAGRDIARFGQ